MAYYVGSGVTAYDLLDAIHSAAVSEGWIPLETRNHTYMNDSRLCFVQYQAPGDGNDIIYMQFRIPNDGSANIIMLDSSAGYDDKLFYWEQPGSIQQWLSSEGEVEIAQPAFTVTANEAFNYWIFISDYRLIVVTRMSTVYESMYIGFLNPISSERQYPYPMYVAGNTVGNGGRWNGNMTGSFVFPRDNTGMLRRSDGTWRSFNSPSQYPNWNELGVVFPYTACNKSLVTNYCDNDSGVLDNLLLIPVILQTNDPVDVCGILRGVYWNSGTRDVAAEQIVSYNGDNYMIFDTKDLRGTNSYYCVRLE